MKTSGFLKSRYHYFGVLLFALNFLLVMPLRCALGEGEEHDSPVDRLQVHEYSTEVGSRGLQVGELMEIAQHPLAALLTESSIEKPLAPEFDQEINIGTLAQADLTPYKPGNWNNLIPIGISQLNYSQGHTYAGPYYSDQTFYFNWGSVNQGGATASGYTIHVEVTGTGGQTWTWSPVSTDPGYWVRLENDFAIGPLSVGNHAFKLWLDYTGVISESNEANNYYERTINVESPPAITPTPAVPTPTPQPQAEIVLNKTVFRTADRIDATFRLHGSIERPFNAFAVIIRPNGSMLNAITLSPAIRPVALNAPGLNAPFNYTLLATSFSGIPRGIYEIVVAFFDPSKPITGRGDAFLDVSSKFEVVGSNPPPPTKTPGMTPTPAGTATPVPDPWYAQYGPSGSGDVVKIGSVYVASWKDGTGCAANLTKTWANAVSWADGLSWLGKTDWRLPTKDELAAICASSGSLGSYQASGHWSSTEYSSLNALYVNFSGCYYDNKIKTDWELVRAVRGVE